MLEMGECKRGPTMETENAASAEYLVTGNADDLI